MQGRSTLAASGSDPEVFLAPSKRSSRTGKATVPLLRHIATGLSPPLGNPLRSE
ncbi:Hypothetical protein AA314_08433 [Archangium gephyra]|uniref:Uncharacterized protein n=1 Tax=Archangium gephyra TaxID=48 RepID=A0AAC8THX7_9BACT|nr:Hypothetical protein AA314_08433 [Archangium gephyra]